MQKIYDFIKETLSKEMATNGFPLIYKGQLTHEITKLFTHMAEKKIENRDVDFKVKKKVYHVMVEFLQNITKHSDDYDDPQNPIGNGIFIVGEEKDFYYVMTGNKIKNDKLAALKKRIDNLNSLDKSELNELFKQQMKVGQISDKGGAGLGLIDLVRKTGKKIDYEFVDIGEDDKFFIVALQVPFKNI